MYISMLIFIGYFMEARVGIEVKVSAAPLNLQSLACAEIG
jgi:hypothetical protein